MFNMPEGRVANWVVGNHDNTRLVSRFPDITVEQSKVISIIFAQLTMTLPGTNFIYNGEELGMLGLTEMEIPTECQVDIQKDSRDKCRNPMQWNSNQTDNYGFSTCDPATNSS